MSPNAKRTLSEQSPAMSTRSKRVKPNTLLPQQRPKLARSIEAEESNMTLEMIPGTRKQNITSEKVTNTLAEQSMPSPSLTPALTPPPTLALLRAAKKKMTQKCAAKASSSISDNLKVNDTLLTSPADDIVKFWQGKCQQVFTKEDGFQVTNESFNDTGDLSKRQVIVWEHEFWDESLLQRPGPEKSRDEFKLPDPSMLHGYPLWAEEDCDFSQANIIQPPATLKEYERIAQPKVRNVPILVIECRAADADHVFEWRNPSPQDISRSYAVRTKSRIQEALKERIYTFDAKVNFELTKGWMTQEQCFCATAIGTKIKFWKHVSSYPQLKQCSEVLDRAENEVSFDHVVGEKLAEVKEDGFGFAMEIYGRETFAG